MPSHFVMYHQPESPAYYDITIDRGDSVSIFRIVQFDMLAFLDGTEVKGAGIDTANAEQTPLGEPICCDRGKVRVFDSGPCTVERWNPPVFILQIAGRQFYGTLHILKVEEGYSLRYVRSRNKNSSRP